MRLIDCFHRGPVGKVLQKISREPYRAGRERKI
jgi:hypothetical protein